VSPRPTGLSLRDNLKNPHNEGIANDNIKFNAWCTFGKETKLEAHNMAES
jgi:hypothetical protein